MPSITKFAIDQETLDAEQTRHAEMIQMLELLLRDAKDHKLCSIAATALHNDYSTVVAWSHPLDKAYDLIDLVDGLISKIAKHADIPGHVLDAYINRVPPQPAV